MKLTRMLGLAAVAATAIALFGGAGSASATVLCKVELTSSCPEKATYAANTAIAAQLASGTEAVFKTSLGNLKCKKSSLEGKTTAKEAEKLPAEFTALTFSECTFGMTSCTATTEDLPYSATVSYTSEGDGTAIFSSSGKGPPAAKIVCGFLVNCRVSNELKLAFAGGEPASLAANEDSLALEGSLCPKTATFTATYSLSQPEGGKAFAAQNQDPSTKLCKAAPTSVGGVLVCPAGQAYSGEIKGQLETGQTTTFVSTVGATGTVSCNQTKWAGKFEIDGTSQNPGGVTTLAFNTNNGSCTSSLANNPNVKIELENMPYDESIIGYLRETSPQGGLGYAGSTGAPKIKFIVELGGGNVNCVYGRVGVAGQVTNASGTAESKLGVSGIWGFLTETPVQGTPVCPRTLVQATRMKFEGSAGEKIYVASQ